MSMREDILMIAIHVMVNDGGEVRFKPSQTMDGVYKQVGQGPMI